MSIANKKQSYLICEISDFIPVIFWSIVKNFSVASQDIEKKIAALLGFLRLWVEYMIL